MSGVNKGACSQSCVPRVPTCCPFEFLNICACQIHNLQPLISYYLHVPSICVLKAVESSRGTVELASATSCQLIYPKLHYDLNIPERAGGVCCSQLGCPAAGHC